MIDKIDKFSTLQKNVINIHGNKGRQWLNALPQVIRALSEKWLLSGVSPVPNITWNYVATARSKFYGPVVIKICLDQDDFNAEQQALSCFKKGCVNVQDIDQQHHALLLDQAIPGTPLIECLTESPESAITAYADVVQTLLSHSYIPNPNGKHIRDWFKVFDYLDATSLPDGLIAKAKDCATELLKNSRPDQYIHGDLHCDNIIQNDGQWLVIDPKGIIGNVGFEIANYDFFSKDVFYEPEALKEEFDWRITILSGAFNLTPQHLKDWVFVRRTLGACWMVEGNGDPEFFLTQIKKLF